MGRICEILQLLFYNHKFSNSIMFNLPYISKVNCMLGFSVVVFEVLYRSCHQNSFLNEKKKTCGWISKLGLFRLPIIQLKLLAQRETFLSLGFCPEMYFFWAIIAFSGLFFQKAGITMVYGTPLVYSCNCACNFANHFVNLVLIWTIRYSSNCNFVNFDEFW